MGVLFFFDIQLTNKININNLIIKLNFLHDKKAFAHIDYQAFRMNFNHIAKQ